MADEPWVWALIALSVVAFLAPIILTALVLR